MQGYFFFVFQSRDLSAQISLGLVVSDYFNELIEQCTEKISIRFSDRSEPRDTVAAICDWVALIGYNVGMP